MPIAAAEPLMTPPDLRPLAEDVFVALADAGFASEDALLAYAGPLGLTKDLLDGWVGAGLLHRRSCSADDVNRTEITYVCLAPKGARELAFATARRATGIAPARLKRSSQKRRHDIAVGDVALAALALGRDDKIALLGVTTDESKLSVSALIDSPKGLHRLAMAADLYIATDTSHGLVGLLVEVDRGTVATATMAKKYRGYLAWRRNGGPARDFGTKALRVLTIAPDARRLARLEAVAREANHERPTGFLAFLDAEHARPEHAHRLLDGVAHAIGREDRVPVFSP